MASRRSVAFKIEDPVTPNMVKPTKLFNRIPTPRPTSDELRRKIEKAHQKRLSYAEERLNIFQKHTKRVSETSDRINNLNDSFSRQTEEKLKIKFQNYEQNQMSRISNLKLKLKRHSEKVDKIRKLAESAREEMLSQLYHKQEEADAKKKLKIDSMISRLKEHENKLEKVNSFMSQYSTKAKERMLKRLEKGMEIRENKLKTLMEKLHIHKIHASEVRARKMPNNFDSMNDQNISEYSINWSEMSSILNDDDKSLENNSLNISHDSLFSIKESHIQNIANPLEIKTTNLQNPDIQSGLVNIDCMEKNTNARMQEIDDCEMNFNGRAIGDTNSKLEIQIGKYHSVSMRQDTNIYNELESKMSKLLTKDMNAGGDGLSNKIEKHVKKFDICESGDNASIYK